MRNIARALTTPVADAINQNTDVERIDQYYGVYTNPVVRREHLLADEGSYFVTNNGQAAISIGTGVAFSATAASFCLQNIQSASATAPKRVYPAYLRLEAGNTAQSAASAGIGLFFAITVDQILRYSSGGTVLTANNTNCNSVFSNTGLSNAQAQFGALTAVAASPTVRTIVGQRLMRVAVSATALTLVNVDTFHFNFGGVENLSQTLGSAPAVAANSAQNTFTLPPVVIGAQHSMLLHIWTNATTPAAGNFFVEAGWFER